MRFQRTLLILAAVLLGMVAPIEASASPPSHGTDRTKLVTGLEGGAGSTVGPDGALYVTETIAGRISRVDPRTGRVTTFADGLPPRAIPIGGAMDVAFIGRTAYAIVTLVGFDVGGSETVGLYRIDGRHHATAVADIGSWAVANPPSTPFDQPTGLQYALQRYRGGFLVTDGHHNRVLEVDRHGSIHELATFANVVPTGLETAFGLVLVSQLGPIPHHPEDGKIVALGAGREPREIASGASMLIDVESGPHGKLYGLSQGQWDGVGEGSRALPNTGRLVVVGRHGDLTAVEDRRGQELVLDRPTSVEFSGDTAYVVSVTGDVYRVDGL
jgi:hypothetical protein